MTQVTDNLAASRFELAEAGALAYADYRIDGRRLYIDYVFSPPELRGQGTAGRLMQGVAEQLRGRDLTVVPICGYAAAWFRRHAQYADLLA